MDPFVYNPNPRPDPSEREKSINLKFRCESECENEPDRDGWYAKIDKSQEKLMVIYQKTNKKTNEKRKETYIVDGFENKTGCNFYRKGSDKEINIANDAPGLWYSFNPNAGYGDFHIVPDKSIKVEVKIDLSEWLKYKLCCIKEKVKETKFYKEPDKPKSIAIGPGEQEKSPHTWNHKYIRAKIGENEFLMSFNRLWCDVRADGKHICNNFGQVQFMAYPRENGHGDINSFPNGFKLMYPRSGDDDESRIDLESKHLTYNAPYDINSSAEEIAQAFVEFIQWCEAKEQHKETAQTT